MLINKLLTYCDKISTDDNIRKNCMHIFFSPYYLYIEDQITTIFTENNFNLTNINYKDLSLQIVNFVNDNYFVYIYPFEYSLALQNGLVKDLLYPDGSNDFIRNLSCSKNWINYLFKKYPILFKTLDFFTEQIIDYINELILNFKKDSEIISENFGIENH